LEILLERIISPNAPWLFNVSIFSPTGEIELFL
jgi:hypothetical protein